ncbi:hypothetical protein BDB00DRAFT_810440 [Zychaea mexicana]|uniref:uncharacterized protein n=1 Tax=Zychaea mexicana TaxID=64656 RepID=UPI0022FF18CE|nr:uncharacterized protein BDB00DRAFT_810440 [Zychaea mexicana]KAI9496087.1 hypothetical protein BDB00DRAFT_810440 [Zychaea mexicana]
MDNKNDNRINNHNTSSFNTWRSPPSLPHSSTLDKTELNKLRKNPNSQCHGIDKHRKNLLQRRKQRLDVHKHQSSRIPIKTTRIHARNAIHKATSDLADAIALVGLSSSSPSTSSRVTTNNRSNSRHSNNNNNRYHDNNLVINTGHNTLSFTLTNTHFNATQYGHFEKEQK